MRKSPEFILMGMLAVASLLVQACATGSGSVGGDELMADGEYVDEPMIKHIPPAEFSMTPSRTRPSLRAELAAINATGLAQGALPDVLFDFDQAILRKDALPILDTNAQRLLDEGVTHLLLEGRGDEVGTGAYNIVLGERRAKAVKSYMQELELPIQFKTTSYGKDRPFCVQHSDKCMQRNRSVHFVVKE